MTDKCPNAKRIRGLLDGSLPNEEADELQLHIERCEVCQTAMKEQVADGSFWESAGKHLAEQQSSGPELERVMDELRQKSPEEAEQIGEAIELKLSFIEPPVEPGTIGRLQHYDILRVAGRGGMGIVVKPFDRSLRRVVAIKLLAPHLARNSQARQRFVREGRAAAGICHEHVVTIHAVEENPPFLVMQYVHGETLESRIHRNGALDIRETVRIAKQIAQGLAAAHAQGVVHRDIKPANILLENGVARVRITDFGLARAVDDASLTQSGVVAGTPQYMAPEQASGDAVDERADLFSLGSVIYTMLAGHAPFRATTAMGVLKRLCDHSARPIREINPDVPDWLMLIINRLHAKRPADRFQSAAEVGDLLERGLASLQQGVPPKIEMRASSARAASLRPLHVAGVEADHQAAAASDSERSVPGWLMFRIPLWLILIPIVLFLMLVLPFVDRKMKESQVAALIGTGIVIGMLWLGWKWSQVLSRIGTNADADAAGRESVPSRGGFERFFLRSESILPRGWTDRVFWLVIWTLPVTIWTVVFYLLESRALSSPQLLLIDSDLHMMITAGVVVVLWWMIALVWFRRKRPDGSSIFPERRGRRAFLTVLLASLFCSLGLWTWFTDVHYLAEWKSRAITTNQYQGWKAPVGARTGRHSVKLEFESPRDGCSVVIELPDGEHYEFGAEHSGVVMTSIGTRPGTFPWRAFVGHTEFASGKVTLRPDQVAEIKVPKPRLRDLIAGRWRSEVSIAQAGGNAVGGDPAMSGSSGSIPSREVEIDQHRLLMVQRIGDQGILYRNDFSIEIDDSIEPALINLLGSDGTRLSGILRFLPGRVPQTGQMSGGAAAAGGMIFGVGSSPAGGIAFGRPDILELCINNGTGLRPWEFKTDSRAGQELFRLQRNHKSETLRSEMSYQPVPTAAYKELVAESIAAWAKKLKVDREGRNSLGMELVLVPPTEFKQTIPELPPITLPDTKANTADLPPSLVAQIAVTYPFVISRRPVSVEQFRKFVEATDYVTDAELGTALPKGPPMKSDARRVPIYRPSRATGGEEQSSNKDTAKQPAVPGGWRFDKGEFVFEEGLSLVDASHKDVDPSQPVILVSWRDAVEFCRWLSKTENRQYRLPTGNEWATAIQLGAPTFPPAPSEAGEPISWANFDSRAEHILKIQTPESLFAEWTQSNVFPEFHLLARKTLSPDGSRFGWSPQYSAGQTFRANTIGFRIVAELQVLTKTAADASEPTDQK